ncbi:MAG: hypothetical protein KDD82_10755, partial [Planctomycetes bacterium]|nr:hypothetical protein [Planctomycetota bacterium]
MLRRTSFACVLALAACQEPQPRKQVDPDLWDPRHEALINQDEPPERREPEFTRASRSGAASATLSEAAREHREGATELEKAEAAQERAAARQSAREQELHSRELRSEGHHLKPEIWVGKEGITD